MISIANREPARPDSSLQCLLQGVPRAYAILFFSPDSRFGCALLAISLLVPGIGICGLAGVFAAGFLALAFGFDRSNVRNGYLLFNPLLVCLTLGWISRLYDLPPAAFVTLWFAAVIGGFFSAVALQHWFAQQFQLSPQSIPSMLCGYILCFVALTVSDSSTLHIQSANPLLDLHFLPAIFCTFFETFGAMIFEPRALPGILAFLAMLICSPLTTVIASSSLAVGTGTMILLGFPFGANGVVWCGFNFLLCGIALGTAYFVPSRASWLLAMISAFLCAFVVIACAAAFRYFGLAASALPYNLVVLALVYALRRRAVSAGLQSSPSPEIAPETARRFAFLNAVRFPHLQTPALTLPFAEECVITQGVDGALTHRGIWNWALDFEIFKNGQRQSANGERLEDFYTFDKPVLAPCDGVIANVISHIRENPPGENNPEENWGNCIVIYNAAGFYVVLAHLRQNSSLIAIGERVACGQPIAHCGNSGRSPVPHLHLQVQAAPQIGSATKPFCLRNYLAVSENKMLANPLQYCTSGVPKQNERLMWPAPLPALQSLLANWLPGEYRYRISTGEGRFREETILLDFDELGRFRFRSQDCKAQFSAIFVNQVFYAIDCDAPGESLLTLFAIGLARVPCIADPGATWRDFADAAPFHSRFLRRLRGLNDLLFGPGLLAFDYSLQAGERGFDIHCRNIASHRRRIPPHAPRSITTTVAAGFGVVRLEAHLWNGTKVVTELSAPSTPAAQPGLPAFANHHFLNQKSTIPAGVPAL